MATQTATKKLSKLKNREKRENRNWGWFLIAPTLIGLLILNIIPVIQTFIMSFQKPLILYLWNIFPKCQYVWYLIMDRTR